MFDDGVDVEEVVGDVQRLVLHRDVTPDELLNDGSNVGDAQLVRHDHQVNGLLKQKK